MSATPPSGPPPQLLVATTNPHKLEEISAVLAKVGLAVIPLGALPRPIEEPLEDQDTFEGNARLKALYYARATGRPCLADDSGLEVDALDGRPGVHSARYAGLGSTRQERDHANNAKLLADLQRVPDAERTARFVCAMCVADPTGAIIAESRGTFEGRIAHAPRGRNGFGYDPLLILPDGRTSAELSPDEKNQRSHRARAAVLIAPQLSRAFPAPPPGGPATTP